jgi:glutamate racemase
MNQPAPIIVFDSGVGGLSIVEPIRRLCPTQPIHYLADNAMFPYGQLDEVTLIERTTSLISQCCEKTAAQLVVIACNSASTLSLPPLRQILSIPVVGVVPAIKPAAAISSSKVIGLLATEGTVSRRYTDQLIEDFAQDCEVIRVGSSKLVALIEQKLRGDICHQAEFDEILTPLREHPGWEKLDTVVLACTHFPLAKQELQDAAPEVVHWIDSGDAIARRVAQLLENSTDKRINQSRPQTAFFTAPETVNAHLQQILYQQGFEQIKAWPEP